MGVIVSSPSRSIATRGVQTSALRLRAPPLATRSVSVSVSDYLFISNASLTVSLSVSSLSLSLSVSLSLSLLVLAQPLRNLHAA